MEMWRSRADIMVESKPDSALKVGLLLVALTWFLFSGYQFIKGAFNIGRNSFWISLTDTSGTFGLGFRTMAGLIAVFTIIFFLAKKDLTKPELLMSIRWVIIGEAVAQLALFPCVIWSIALAMGYSQSTFGLGSFFESTLPVFFVSIIVPITLATLFFKLGSNKPANGAIKWGLITGTVYIFMFWIDNTGNWIGAIERKGIEYVTAYPDHILSLGLTSVGLLALALYAAYFTKKNWKASSLAEVDLRKIGAIVTLVGLYFLTIYVMWLFLGTDAKWSTWYAWFLGHNMDLWALSLPLVGIPLMFYPKPTKNKPNPKPKT
jgi:hypothetical protein